MSYIPVARGRHCEVCGLSMGRGSAKSKKTLCEDCQRVQDVYAPRVQSS